MLSGRALLLDCQMLSFVLGKFLNDSRSTKNEFKSLVKNGFTWFKFEFNKIARIKSQIIKLFQCIIPFFDLIDINGQMGIPLRIVIIYARNCFITRLTIRKDFKNDADLSYILYNTKDVNIYHMTGEWLIL